MKHYFPGGNTSSMLECYNEVVAPLCECAKRVKEFCDLELKERKLRELLISKFDALCRVSGDGSCVAEVFLEEMALQRETQDAKHKAEAARKRAQWEMDEYKAATEARKVAAEAYKRDHGHPPIGNGWFSGVVVGEKPANPDSIEIPEVVAVSDGTAAAFSRLFAEQSDIIAEIVSVWVELCDVRDRINATKGELLDNVDALTTKAKDKHDFECSVERERLAAEEAARLRRQNEINTIDSQLRDLRKRRESLAGSAI